MTRIVVQAHHSDGEPRRWTLSERIVAENLDSDHYMTQLVERLRWAAADAEALESQSADLASHHDGEAQPGAILPRGLVAVAGNDMVAGPVEGKGEDVRANWSPR